MTQIIPKKNKDSLTLELLPAESFWSSFTRNDETESGLSVAEEQHQLNAGNMKSNSNKRKKKVGEMRAEYDFSGGGRGKHAAAYRQGHTVTVHKKDGTTIVQNFKLEEGAVILEPDVREYFPDAQSVNNALRTLISIVPKTRKKTSKARSRQKRTSPSRSASR